MKSTVEKLSPTRVRSVEVPFDGTEARLARLQEDGQQIRLPGFRPGKARPANLEQRVGQRGMLDEVVNEAVPGRYSEAVPRRGQRARPARDRGHQNEDGEHLASPPRSTSAPRSRCPT